MAWLANNFEDWVYRETLRMNERGLPVDTPLVKSVIKYIEQYNAKLVEEFIELTGGVTPTQVQQLKLWFEDQGLKLDSLERVGVERILKTDIPDNIRRVLEIRLELGRVSTKKLYTILRLDSGDGRVRGSFIYHGAGPGRWTAQRLQPHNFQRPTIKNVDRVIDLLEKEDYDTLETEFPDNVMEAIGSAMRGFIKAPDGQLIVRADYSAIEARVLAWLAGEKELVLAFHEGKDIYVDMAGTIFGEDPAVILEGHKANILKYSDMRKLGKDTILGCGYQMFVSTFLCQAERKGSDDVGGIPIRLDEAMIGQRDEETFNSEAWDLAYTAVTSYRTKYKRIVNLWKDCENAVIAAINNPGCRYRVQKKITFQFKDGTLRMWLPSGRPICYPEARLEQTTWYNGRTKTSIKFKAVSDKGIWRWEYLYGGKIVENAVQGIARDIMAYGMWNAAKRKFANIGTVHDEIIALYKRLRGKVTLARRFERIICSLPEWAIGPTKAETIPLTAEGVVSLRYGK